MADADFGCQEKTGHGGQQGCQQIGADLDTGYRHAVAPCGLFAEAGRLHLKARPRAIEPEVSGSSQCEQQQCRCWQEADAHAKEFGKGGIDQTARNGPQHKRQTLQDRQHGDGRDHRIDIGEADQRPVCRTHNGPNRKHQQHTADSCGQPSARNDIGGHDHRNAHEGADGNVEAADHQYKQLRHRDQSCRCEGQQQVAEIDWRQKDGALACGISADKHRQHCEENDGHPGVGAPADQGREYRSFCGPAFSRSVGAVPGCQEAADDLFLGHLIASEFLYDPAARENQDTIADAGQFLCVGRIDHAGAVIPNVMPDRLVDLVSCPGVNALCRFINEDCLRTAAEATGQDRFLLVAAREAGDGDIEACRDNAETVAHLSCRLPLALARKQTRAGEIAELAENHIALNREFREHGFAGAVSAEERHSPLHRSARATRIDRLA